MSEIIKVLNRASSALSNVMQRHPGYEFSELRTLLAGAVGSVSVLEEDNARMQAELEAVGAGGVQPLRKDMVPLSDVLERLAQGFGRESAPVTTIRSHFAKNAAQAKQGEQA